MSGDVQPRKRRDKKRKKDELSAAEELRGTSAVFGEGDVLMHSHHEHGTGGHWCAKVIFFSLLAVLIMLVGLIILENRGLSELEANAVESRYTGVLEGWLEDTTDDHHDAHTLELTHPDEVEHDEAEGSDEVDQEVELEDIEHEPPDDDDDEIDEPVSKQFRAEPYSAQPSAEQDDEDDGKGDDSDDHDGQDDDDDGEQDEDASEQSEEADTDGDDEDFLEHGDDDEDENDGDEDFLEHGDDDEDENDGDEDEQENVSAPESAESPYEEVDESSEQLPADSLLEEEEYERRQEEIREEEAAASHLWLKLGVGAALLLATHAVVRRATRRADNDEEEDVDAPTETPEEPPTIIDRRMTLLLEEPPIPVVKKSVAFEAPMLKTMERRVIRAPTPQDESDEEPEEEIEEEVVIKKPTIESRATPDRELESEEDDEPENPMPAPKLTKSDHTAETETTVDERETESEGDVPDDVEIIEDEQLEEQEDEEEVLEEEEVSDVDDSELLSRLEAKYGRLPEPERYGQKEGGNNRLEDQWMDEPNDDAWRRELDLAEDELHQGSASAALARTGAAELSACPRARWLAARALDALAEEKRDNRLLGRSIAAYLELLKMHERLSDTHLRSIAARAIERIRFKGNPLEALPVHELLITRFPEEPQLRNDLVISYLIANRVDLACEVLKETLKRWPNDRVALAHYGFVLKTRDGQLEEAVELLQKALEGDGGDANEARFYYHLGDALLMLDRREEAHKVHKQAADLGHFKSAAQRSLYNVDRLTAKPWWDVDSTPYNSLVKNLEASWREILREGEAARALYEAEKEGLRERGEWSQLDLFARGREIPGRCARAPVTCKIVKKEAAAVGCRRGQIKFSSLEPGTHIRPHVGPTNCRLRMHLGLSNTEGAHLRVDKETRQWQLGKVLVFDDSFEHEVWHNGTGTRLVLIVDTWHPELTLAERRELPAI